MTGDPEYIPFLVARTPSEANLVRALLDGAGIPAHVEGGMLADEFAVSQRLMNAQGVRVFVRSDHVARARQVLADAAVSDEELEQQALAAAAEPGAEQPLPRHAYPVEPKPSEIPSSSMVPVVLAGVFAVLTILFFGLWLEERGGRSVEDPLYVYDVHEHGLVYRWRHNGADAVRQIDRDGDGVSEEVRYFNRDGDLLTVSYDADGNGLHEEGRTFNGDGDLVAVSYDADADGLAERLVEHRQGGLRFEWLDEDGDGRYDRCRVLGEADEVLRELRYAGAAGFLQQAR